MRVILLILLILSLPASALGTTVINLWDQFPDNQGDNKLYAYGYAPSVYWELPNSGSYSFRTSGGWGIPLVERSTTPWIYMHPSWSADAVLAWKPGNTVAYELDISGSFQGNNTGSKRVYKNDTVVLWSSVISSGSAAFNLTDIILNPGKTLYFGVNSNGGDSNDGTLLSGTMTVPVPSTLILMLSGLGGLWGWRRFK